MHRPTGLPWELPRKTAPIAKHPTFSIPLPCPPRLREIFHPIHLPARQFALLNRFPLPAPRRTRSHDSAPYRPGSSMAGRRDCAGGQPLSDPVEEDACVVQRHLSERWSFTTVLAEG